LVKQKAAGKTVKFVEKPAKADNVISLMDALKQSLKGKAPVQRPARASRTPRAAKKTSRSTARQRKAG
jgi:non-homologous end joining protein Ku